MLAENLLLSTRGGIDLSSDLDIKSGFEYLFKIWESFFDITALLDIIFVSVLFYFAYKFIKERRAGKLAIGVVLLFLIHFVSNIFDLYVMQFIMQNVFQVGIITLVILFQPELRSALEKMGAQPLKGLKSIGERDTTTTEHMIDEVADAVCDMSLSKTGALMVFERTTMLGDLGITGTILDAEPTSFLIKNIFFNKAPLHDGAVIVRNNRLYSAGCLLPLSDNPDIIKDLGTRHRAAIGMSENSDALVIVVSEETGVISAALEGKLTRNYNKETLKKLMKEQLIGGADKPIGTLGRIAHTVESKKNGKNGGHPHA